MEKLQCKACGCFGMIPMEVLGDRDFGKGVLNPAAQQDSRFYTCHVCGDNWLSVREVSRGDSRITFVHQMGMSPELKRIAYLEAPFTAQEVTVDHWEYYLGDEAVTEEAWHEKLVSRRKVLKSICSN